MSQSTDIIRNPVRRDGVSQRQRRLAALDPAFVKVDERTLEDFLVFTLGLSKQICFFNLDNQPDGNWEAFWGCDPTVVIAAIEKTNPLPLKQAFDAETKKTPSVQGLSQLFKGVLDAARKIDDWYRSLEPGSSLNVEIKRLITANFGDRQARQTLPGCDEETESQENITALLPYLLALEKGAKAQFSDDYPEPDVNNYAGFSPEWKIDVADWDPATQTWKRNLAKWEAIPTDGSLFLPEVEINSKVAVKCLEALSPEDMLKAAYPRLQELFTAVYNVCFQIIQIAPAHFKKSLERRDHPAHLALFIAFLMLYAQVQDDLNRLTKRHLDFYFKEVLQLKPKAAVPDKAHLFFELAKNVIEYELTGGIRFKAGKDALGVNLFYTLDNNTVLSTTKVESLRTIFQKIDNTDPSNRKVVNVHAAAVANSADGNGAAFPKDEEKPSWATLGNVAMPKASFGFAIASNELLLGEGSRTVILDIHGSPDATPATSDFDIYLSGEKKWLDVPVYQINPAQVVGEPALPADGFRIKFTLDPAVPAVVPFDAGILKEDFGTTLPVLKILLRQPADTTTAFAYEQLRNLTLQKIGLIVQVTGIQKVVAFNDEGAVDTSKPFFPFGSNPKVSSSFFVGNAEAFQKSLDSVTVNLGWEQVPGDIKNYYKGYDGVGFETPADAGDDLTLDSFEVKFASIAKTENISTQKAKIFTPLDANGKVNLKVSDGALPPGVPLPRLLSVEKIPTYGQDTKEGFLRLDLQRDFEHDQFQQVLTRQMLAVSKFPTVIGGAYYLVEDNTSHVRSIQKGLPANHSIVEVIIPNPPHTPTLKSITLDYSSTVDTSADADALLFLHLHPFANAWQHFSKVTQQQPAALLPQFKFETLTAAQTPEPHLEEGALLIGLSNLQPRQSLTLLFQLAENTADADVPKSTVRWYFLADNVWQPFKDFQVASDTTDALITSGIVELTIPDGINLKNTILPPELHWLKASVEKYAGSVSEAVNVHAQAARVTFQDNANDPAHLAKPLPASSIAKLEVADAAVKGIEQRYESFGGLPAEDDLSFYVRVSERLRHKGRAITQWDYERLVLDAFPSIYKVKCINHTDGNGRLHPGHVLLSVVPDFTKLKAVDRRQPKVTLAELEKIKRYLDERNSGFVFADADPLRQTLHVLNPDYDEISVNFDVRFMPQVTAIDFHVQKLREGIVRYLSPWAYDDGGEINFGGKVYKSSILHFVEKQPYVDYVVNFTMSLGTGSPPLDVIEAATPRTILVPVTESLLNISPILEDHYCPMENPITGSSLGYLTLEETTLEP